MVSFLSWAGAPSHWKFTSGQLLASGSIGTLYGYGAKKRFKWEIVDLRRAGLTTFYPGGMFTLSDSKCVLQVEGKGKDAPWSLSRLPVSPTQQYLNTGEA